MTCTWHLLHFFFLAQPHVFPLPVACTSFFSLSAQVIKHGLRSAGYGFISFSSAESAEKVVEALNKKELDGRDVVIEIAKPSDQKDNEKRERRPRRRFGRRGYYKAVPGEVTEAEADGETPKGDGAGASEPTQPNKPKKKKKSSVCC